MNNFISQQEDDPMGKLFAIYSLLPLVIVIIFATAFFIRFLLMKLVSRFCWRGGGLPGYTSGNYIMAQCLTASYQAKTKSTICYQYFDQERFAHPHLCHGCHNQLYGKLCSQTGKYWNSPLELNIDLQYLAEPRPMKRDVQFEEFGMPSSHR